MTKPRSVFRRPAPRAREIAAVAACLVATTVVACSSGSPGGERVAGCRERPATAPQGRDGKHVSNAFFGPNEVPRDRDLQQVVRDGAVLIRFRPSLAAEDRRALRDFVTKVDRRWAIAAAAPDQSEAITAVTALRALRCADFRLGSLRAFRDNWIAQVEGHGGSIAGLAAAAAGGRAKTLGKRGRTINIGARDLPAGAWPLTIRSGQLRCRGAGAVIFRAPGGKDYGITGAAVDAGMPPLNSLWTDKPGQPGTSMDITPLVNRGLALCDPPLDTLAATQGFARQQLRRARAGAPRPRP